MGKDALVVLVRSFENFRLQSVVQQTINFTFIVPCCVMFCWRKPTLNTVTVRMEEEFSK